VLLAMALKEAAPPQFQLLFLFLFLLFLTPAGHITICFSNSLSGSSHTSFLTMPHDVPGCPHLPWQPYTQVGFCSLQLLYAGTCFASSSQVTTEQLNPSRGCV